MSRRLFSFNFHVGYQILENTQELSRVKHVPRRKRQRGRIRKVFGSDKKLSLENIKGCAVRSSRLKHAMSRSFLFPPLPYCRRPACTDGIYFHRHCPWSKILFESGELKATLFFAKMDAQVVKREVSSLLFPLWSIILPFPVAGQIQGTVLNPHKSEISKSHPRKVSYLRRRTL